jgi:hypothetical protein
MFKLCEDCTKIMHEKAEEIEEGLFLLEPKLFCDLCREMLEYIQLRLDSKLN